MDLSKTNEVGFQNKYPDVFIGIKSILLERDEWSRNECYYIVEVVFYNLENANQLIKHIYNCYYEKILIEDVIPFGMKGEIIVLKGYIIQVDHILNEFNNEYLECKMKIDPKDIIEVSRFFKQKTIDSPIQNF